jgi:hypothetical protein
MRLYIGPHAWKVLILFTLVGNVALAQSSSSSVQMPNRLEKPRTNLRSNLSPKASIDNLGKSTLKEPANNQRHLELETLDTKKPPVFQFHLGGSDGGGGDSYTLDFIQTVALEIYPNAKKYPDKYKAAAAALLDVADPERVISKQHVYESCNDSENGREVEICYSRVQDMFQVSRTMYPIDKRNSASKRGLIVHELYRRLKIEGNKYEETKQVAFDEESDEIKPFVSILTRMTGKDGNGDTQIVTNDFIRVSPNDKIRLVVKSKSAIVANLGVKLFKQATPTTISQVGDGEVLSFESEMRKSKEFLLEPNSNYAISFRGQAVAAAIAFGQSPTDPFSISMKLEGQDGRSIVDFGEILIQSTVKTQKPLQCDSQSHELVDRIAIPSSILLHGTLHIQVGNK